MYDASLRRRALIVLHSCISTLGVMSGAYKVGKLRPDPFDFLLYIV